MNILLLNQYYPPDTSATASIVEDLAQALAARHQVTVVAGRPSYAPRERHAYYLARRQQEGRLTTLRVGSTAFDRRRMAGRAVNYLSYLGLALAIGLSRRPRPDVIIAMTDPPVANIMGALIALVRRTTLVYNIRDLHPDMAVASGAVNPSGLTWLWERIHRWSIRRAKRVIVLGDDMRERIVAKGMDPQRVIVVRDGATPPGTARTSGTHVADEVRGGAPFVVVHAGNLGFAGAWETLIEAARTLDGVGIRLVFVGDGSRLLGLMERAQGLDRVAFLPFRPAEELPDLLAAADLHVVTVRPGLSGLIVPSKLYPILMAGRPVLAVAPPDSDVARIVQREACGLVADPDDPEDVARMMRWAHDHPEELVAMGKRAREAGKRFERKDLIQDFVRVIEELETA